MESETYFHKQTSQVQQVLIYKKNICKGTVRPEKRRVETDVNQTVL
jgi:hypothetical protein